VKVKKKIVEKPPRNSAGFCGGGQGLSWIVEPRKEERIRIRRGIDPCILDLGTRWRRVVSFTLRPPYPSHMRLGEPQSRPGRCGEEKNSQPLPGLKPPIIQSASFPYTFG
jgi:hypothetical protein